MLSTQENDWKLYGIMFPLDVLTSSSLYFVVAIVSLRLLVVKHPMNFQALHEKFGRIGSIVIWTIPVLVYSASFVLALPSFHEQKVLAIFNFIAFQVTRTLPVLLTVVLYTVLLRTLKRNAEISSDSTSARKRSLTKMTHGIVASLIICNVPFIVWAQWYNAMYFQGKVAVISGTNSGVRFFVVIYK